MVGFPYDHRMEGTKGQHVQVLVKRIITVIAHQVSSLAQAARQVLAKLTTGLINPSSRDGV